MRVRTCPEKNVPLPSSQEQGDAGSSSLILCRAFLACQIGHIVAVVDGEVERRITESRLTRRVWRHANKVLRLVKIADGTLDELDAHIAEGRSVHAPEVVKTLRRFRVRAQAFAAGMRMADVSATTMRAFDAAQAAAAKSIPTVGGLVPFSQLGSAAVVGALRTLHRQTRAIGLRRSAPNRAVVSRARGRSRRARRTRRATRPAQRGDPAPSSDPAPGRSIAPCVNDGGHHASE